MEASTHDPSALAPIPSPSMKSRPRARFFLEGVRNPVLARVERSDHEGMTLRQELPFLKLDGQVRGEDGREAHLASVGVALEDGTPSLVLELRYQAAALRADATMPFELPDDAPRATRRRDETIPFGVMLALPEEPAHGHPLEGEDDTEPAPIVPWTGEQPWYVDLWITTRTAAGMGAALGMKYGTKLAALVGRLAIAGANRAAAYWRARNAS